MHTEFRPKLWATHPGTVHIQSPCLNAVARGAGGLVESVKPSEVLLLLLLLVVLVVVFALAAAAAMGLEYESGDGNCPRECKSPIDAVARKTPIRDKSAMSSTNGDAGRAGAGAGAGEGCTWALGLTGGTVGVLVLLLPRVSSCRCPSWSS
jgi:hypothetical protein